MSETKETKICKKAIYYASGAYNLGIYGAFEVTFGKQYGQERVDFMTMTSDGKFYCYEVKVSKEDFKSNAKKSFYGDYNYFIMPESLYEELENDEDLRKYMMSGIGVYTVNLKYETAKCVRKAKKKNSFQDYQIMMFGMIRSLSRYTKIEIDKITEGETK